MWYWELTLGIVFFVVWVCIVLYAQTLRNAYMLGQMDYIMHKNRTHDYTGLGLLAYNKGRKKKAIEYKLKVHSKGQGFGNPIAG